MDNEREVTAYELLEKIQQKYWELSEDDFYREEDSFTEEVFLDLAKKIYGEEKASETIALMMKEYNSLVLKTKYQSKWVYQIMVDIMQSIEEIKDQVFKETLINKDMPCFGSVHYGMFSAEVCSPQCSDKLIIISDGLFIFAHLISKVVAQMFPIGEDAGNFSFDKNRMKEHINNSPEIKLRFFDVMLACLYTNESPKARQYVMHSGWNDMLDLIRDSFETFVIGHEYAHAALGHLENKNINEVKDLEDWDNVDESEIGQIIHNWDEELQADIVGAGLTIQVMRKRGIAPVLGALGIIVCTKSFDLFEKLDCLRAGESPEKKRKFSKTHPPGEVRQRAVIELYFKDEDAELFTAVCDMIDYLWNEFEEFYRMLKSDIIKKDIDIREVPFFLIQHILYKLFDQM